MQLLFEESEEAPGLGIGFFAGSVRRLRARTVPQMGWNDVEPGPDPIFGQAEGFPAYYANSFVCAPSPDEPPNTVIARSEYEGEVFVAAVRKERCWGLQFHPEKSSDPGLRLLANFIAEVEASR
jgi:glutamine amidotransferase